MSKLLPPFVLAALSLVLAACTAHPPLISRADYCDFKPRAIAVGLPKTSPNAQFAGEPDNAVLLLSGGSQHGAFGAGLLARWKEITHGLPRFQTVTGISTGALLSTDAFIDRPEAAERAYSIERESQLLTAYGHADAKGDITLSSYPSIIRHNAVADLGPLENQLYDHIDLATLRAVKQRGAGRRLLIGAVDVDSGDAVVFDMLRMATRAVEAADAGKADLADHLRHCYVKAIVASSAVPLAARPVVIDNRLYIDGGARFGVFIEKFGDDPELAAKVKAGAPPQLYILVNGQQRVEPHCGKADAARCGEDGSDRFDNFDGQHGGWSLLGLAKRASDILIAQIYSFSVADIAARYREQYGELTGHLHYFWIVSAMMDHRYDGDTCRHWETRDQRELKPLQFHPRYMKCLISFGRAYADAHADELRAGRTQPAPALPPGSGL